MTIYWEHENFFEANVKELK